MNKGTLVIVMQLVGVGWYVAFCIIGGLVGGLWLDGRLDMVPVFTLAGIVVGTALAFYGTYKMVLPLMNGSYDTEKRDEE